MEKFKKITGLTNSFSSMLKRYVNCLFELEYIPR